MNEFEILLILIGFGAGFLIAYWVKGKIVSQKIKAAQSEASRILADAKLRSETLVKEANLGVKDKLFKMKSEFDAETKETRAEIKRLEKRLITREENIDRKIEQFDAREQELVLKEKRFGERENELKKNESKYHELISEQKKQLEKISGLTAEQAKELLIRAMENDARYEGAKLIKRIETETKEEADKKAKKIISTACRWYRFPMMR